MRKLIIFCVLSLISGLQVSPALAVENVEVNVSSDHLFLPRGFDNNDSVELIVTGELPNLCYRGPHVEVDRSNPAEIKLQVKASIDPAPDAVCAMMVYPYREVVNLGALPAGPYRIKMLDDNGAVDMESSMLVVPARSSNPDDHVYADVESVRTFTNSNRIVLEGQNPSDCFELDRIEISDNGRDTYAVQPIMKQVRDFCPMKLTDFSYEANLPGNLRNEKILIHVRRMNGKSVNKVLYMNEQFPSRKK